MRVVRPALFLTAALMAACAHARTTGSVDSRAAEAQSLSTLPNDVILVLDGDMAKPSDHSAAAEAIRARIRALSPDRIERVEIMKGSAAAAIYGPTASMGVISIFTKR